ncbi:Imm19 family immunity protein [Pedobacter ureilyticus]|uniref:Imm19 family immunity protein n=1 Tax=Pedobacter ureilyticus TaxID=1393051 RepID=A0ABW9J2L9_9SPHI|nr:Imm19 family immunity protein [Pedobacter helvus]
MSRQITIAEIKSNPYFWHMYLKWFRGFDDKNEINLDEAMEVIDIDQNQSHQYEEDFFSDINDENIKFIDEELSENMSIYIEFQGNEIVFFLNEIYIGNLGGHFEAWFFTWKELLAFEKYPPLFLLLLPMVGVEREQVEEAKEFITMQLQAIPSFEKEATYIAYCIVNGLMIDEPFFEQQDIGIINQQNHSVRNVEKYPDYKQDATVVNIALSKFVKSP